MNLTIECKRTKADSSHHHHRV